MRLRDRTETEDNAADGVFGRASSIGRIWMVLIDFIRQRKILISVLSILFLLVILAAWFFLFNSKPEPPKKSPVKPKINKEKPAEPVTAQAPLDGLEAPPNLVDRQAIAVMVENLSTIRPQSGVSQASLVVEALSEGGITRFMLVFQEKDADNIGPVRSARVHYVELAKALDALYAHVGGSTFALAAIKRYNVEDLDQYVNAAAFRRIPSVKAPHNVFTTTAALRALKPFSSDNPPGFEFKKDADTTNRPSQQQVSINFSFPEYAVIWDYQPTTNSYLRINGGRPHTDAATGKQLEAKNIIIMTAPTAPIAGTPLLAINTTGSGIVKVIRDGIVVNGTWSRPGVDDWLVLTDDAGNEIKLNPGQVWLEIVSSTTAVTITTPPVQAPNP